MSRETVAQDALKNLPGVSGDIIRGLLALIKHKAIALAIPLQGTGNVIPILRDADYLVPKLNFLLWPNNSASTNLYFNGDQGTPFTFLAGASFGFDWINPTASAISYQDSPAGGWLYIWG